MSRPERVSVGLIINPIAGMGGAVGLHGTDGATVLAEAVARGATAQAPARAERALRIVASADFRVIAAAGPMGGNLAERLGLSVNVVGVEAAQTCATDTRSAAQAMVAAGVTAILFAGGDGTARDIAAVAGLVPMLGIPSGVKMQSGVFAPSPEAAGRLIADLVTGARVGFRKVEIMDIDEEARRVGRLGARLYGYARAPYREGLLQAAKSRPSLDDDAALDAACVETARELDPATTWLIGPGTTAKRVLRAYGESGTLLGVDTVRGGAVIG
ncbi:MAG: NAD(+)/NADH kinase, partial [Pseudomonadota bacterium]